MPSSGIISGIGADGEPVVIEATDDGRLKVDVPEGDSDAADPLPRILAVLVEILDEVRAARLAAQDAADAGSADTTDYLETARSLRDDDEE